MQILRIWGTETKALHIMKVSEALLTQKNTNALYKQLTLSPPIPLRLYTLPYWSFLIFDIQALWGSVLSARVPECRKLKNSGLHQYGAEPFEQKQFGMAYQSVPSNFWALHIVSYLIYSTASIHCLQCSEILQVIQIQNIIFMVLCVCRAILHEQQHHIQQELRV